MELVGWEEEGVGGGGDGDVDRGRDEAGLVFVGFANVCCVVRYIATRILGKDEGTYQDCVVGGLFDYGFDLRVSLVGCLGRLRGWLDGWLTFS